MDEWMAAPVDYSGVVNLKVRTTKRGTLVLAAFTFVLGQQGPASATPLNAPQVMERPRAELHRPASLIHEPGIDTRQHRPPPDYKPPVNHEEPPRQPSVAPAEQVRVATEEEKEAPKLGSSLSFLHEREQLASAFRALAAAGLSAASGLGNHLTLSVGPDYTRFLLNRYGLHWMEVTAENLVLVDGNGTILEGEGPVQGAAVALHGPIHSARKEKARVIFHTHQPWFTALACIKAGGLRMFHPDACIYTGRVGFDPVYTGNWPMGSIVGSMSEGERLLRVPELKDKDLCFLANHGTLQISRSVEEALFDCFNLERLCKEQVHAMMYASPFRELSTDQVQSLLVKYEATRDRMVTNYFDKHVKHNQEITPIAGAWNGIGEVPLTFGVYGERSMADTQGGSSGNPHVQSSFMKHMVSEDEWSVRVDMAAVCRLLSRLNGHTTYEGSFAHFSYDLGDGTYLVAPADIPFAAMRASHLVVTDAAGTVLRGEGSVDCERFQGAQAAQACDRAAPACNKIRASKRHRFPV